MAEPHRHHAAPPLVLIVEDEDNIAAALSYLMTREGLRHERVADGQAALDRIRALRPEVVLLDVMLPGLSGFEICQQLRMDPAYDAVRLLMMTARGAGAERRKGLALGADGFIAKPFQLAELRDEIRRLLPPGGGHPLGGAG
ncbi:response regulator transcription factor [Frigidibacter sp. MR17.24]|uniref:response regulator transcription factor n=1 Tax=Frigidibacter sp. MR17.24 TaxID=3127345 RepID=UPI003012C69A